MFRKCPKCHRSIPIKGGYHFDDKGNMIHDVCGDIVVKVVAEESKKEVKTVSVDKKDDRNYLIDNYGVKSTGSKGSVSEQWSDQILLRSQYE